MVGQFASRRLAAPMCLAQVLAAQSACSSARSQTARIADPGDWVLVDETADARVHVDRSTLQRDGTRVNSLLRTAFEGETDKTPRARPYAHPVQRRIDDCATGGFAMQSTSYRQEDGSEVELTPMPGGFIPNSPGTRAAHITAEICRLAGLPEPLVANVSFAEVKFDDWRRLGTDPGEGSTVSVLASSARTLDGAAEIVSRTDYPQAQTLPDGRRFVSVVNVVQFDCKGRFSAVASSDFYGSAGELVLAETVKAEETLKRVPRGGLSEMEMQLACAGPRVG